MALNETYHPGQRRLQASLDALRAILSLPDYQPINPACNAAALAALETRLANAERAEQLAQMQYANAHDEAVTSAWELHNTVLMAKAQVIAQYGDDSNEVASLGLKKKSARRRPARRTSVPLT
ncbi:MAG: hypothetical protein JST60_22685 [Chloroflexi bacterium SZAS-1]|jgi:hypothetical protein|nr:hypothetical protein [Chloroflexi bacterium SZAS-1]